MKSLCPFSNKYFDYSNKLLHSKFLLIYALFDTTYHRDLCKKLCVKTVLETGVKSDPAFCLWPSIEKTNSGLAISIREDTLRMNAA